MEVTTTNSELANKPWALINLPPFPAVAARILQLLLQETASIKELSALVQMDIAFSTEILTLANSALFSFRTEITSILQASVLLGFERLKAIALTVGLRSYVRNFLNPGLLGCWRHSLACALVSEQLAAACSIERDQAYVAGLMHDIGRLALATIEPVAYKNLLDEADEKTIDILGREEELFGVDHPEAGKWLAEQWNLPKLFADVASQHHSGPAPGEADMVALVRVACRAADCIGFAAVRTHRPVELQEILRGLPGSGASRVAVDHDQLASMVEAKIKSVE
jgi:putative nucleotidyltransferase with HDIG domain